MVVKVTFNQGWFPDSGRMTHATQTNLPKSLQWFCLLPPSPLRGQCRIFTDLPILLHRRHLSSPKVLYFARSIKTKVSIFCAECAQLHYIKNTTPPARHCQPLKVLKRNVVRGRDKFGNHFFNAGLVKGDFQLVAFGSDNGAIAKFLVKNTHA